MVRIFKTSVRGKKEARRLIQRIERDLPAALINMDLDDRDRILRIEGDHISQEDIVSLIISAGFESRELE